MVARVGRLERMGTCSFRILMRGYPTVFPKRSEVYVHPYADERQIVSNGMRVAGFFSRPSSVELLQLPEECHIKNLEDGMMVWIAAMSEDGLEPVDGPIFEDQK